MSTRTALVPIHLDSLYADDNLEVAAPLVDFTKLGVEDNVYLGSILTNGPFTKAQHFDSLKKGLHLHWALPDALTKSMSQPIVRLQSFRNVFGTESGNTLWQALIEAKWLQEKKAGMAKILVAQAERRLTPAGVLPSQLDAVNALLNSPSFPAVPNRWLVTRFDGISKKQWVVESNYVWPNDLNSDHKGNQLNSYYTSYPITRTSNEQDNLGHCFLGRWYEIDNVPDKEPNEGWLDELTAVGYGEPSFAAFYPNCRSVFGFLDEDNKNSDNSWTYEVLGWYSDPKEQDYFAQFIRDFRENQLKEFPNIRLLSALTDAFQWFFPILIPTDKFEPEQWALLKDKGWIHENNTLSKVPLQEGNTLGAGNADLENAIRRTLDGLIESALPNRMICYARCASGPNNPTQPEAAGVTLSVGNTATEAMSAFLAQQISPDHKAEIEDYLEALQMDSQLEQQQLDLGPKFEETRHQKGFNAMSGGTIWTIRSDREDTGTAHPTDTSDESLGLLLNELNVLQQQFDQKHFEIESLQQQIFSDWCSYLFQEKAVRNNDAGKPSSFSPQDAGFPTQDDDDFKPQRDSVDTHPKENLVKIKNFIEWEIDIALKSRLDDVEERQGSSNLRQQLSEKHQILLTALASFQQKLQYLKTSDINDWSALTAALNSNAALNPSKMNFVGAEPQDILAALNKTLIDDADLYKKLSFSQGNVPKEATELHQYQGLADWIAPVYTRYNRLLLESNLPQIMHRPWMQIQKTGAPRFWQPTEPVIQITGVHPNPRNGQDGRLRVDKLLECSVIDLDGIPTDTAIYTKINSALDGIKQANPQSFAFQSGNGDWHPLFLDWRIDFAQTTVEQNSEDYRYPDNYLNQNYDLPLNAVDFIANPKRKVDNPVPFWGRCILTPSGSLIQKNRIIQNLLPEILAAIKTVLHKEPNIDDFKKWVNNSGNPFDLQLDKIVATKSVYEGGSETQQINNWISIRLADTPDSNLPGIVSWYGEKLKNDLSSFGQKLDKEPYNSFFSWAKERIRIKETFFLKNPQIADENQTDFDLQNNLSFGFGDWLKIEIGDDALKIFFEEQNITAPPDTLTYLKENFNAVIAWYQARVRGILHRVVDYLAYQKLYSVGGLSQALGGFNKAMVNLAQTYQLDIHNPQPSQNGLDADKVRKAVQNKNTYSPQSAGDYAPFVAGKMTLGRINLINSFGQYFPIAKDAAFVCSTSMIWEPGTNDIALAPRIVQPTRLNFRWLAATTPTGQEMVEMNTLPATSPICGWLLPNNLDNSLMVYDPTGLALGYIDEEGTWNVFPGKDVPKTPNEIQNPHLSKTVRGIVDTAKGKSNYIPDFIAVLDTALDNIAPDNSAQHDALALLMGRPIALVGVALSLEQKGLSAPFRRPNAYDPVFLKDLDKFEKDPPLGPDFQRNTYHYESVRIPLRLGEYRQLNDGLVGYWIDSAPKEALPNIISPEKIFFAPQSYDPTTARPEIQTHDEDGAAFKLSLSLDQKEPIILNLLIDPRAKVHATCGMLPVKNIQVPPAQYQQALSDIRIAFLTAPLLSLPGRLHVSLPREPGYGWSWLGKQGNGWTNINSIGTLHRADVDRIFQAQAATVWDQLIASGWIEEITPSISARIIPKDKRTQDLKDTTIQAQVEEMLESLQINPFDPSAAFSGTPEIREGWLMLNKEIH